MSWQEKVIYMLAGALIWDGAMLVVQSLFRGIREWRAARSQGERREP